MRRNAPWFGGKPEAAEPEQAKGADYPWMRGRGSLEAERAASMRRMNAIFAATAA